MRQRLLTFCTLVLAISLFGEAVHAQSFQASPPYKVTPVRSSDGVVMQAYEWGDPAGPPIVFIHGIYQSALAWTRQVKDPSLASKYHLIAFDLRGHGASEKPAGVEYYRDGKRWAADLAAVISTLHLQKPVIVAWSYGGRVLNDYLTIEGDGRLGGIVYVAARSIADGSPDVASPARLKASRDVVSSDPLTFLQGTREFVELCFGDSASAEDTTVLTAQSMQTPLYVRLALSGRPLAYERVLNAIQAPTLIIQGDRDPVVPPRTADYTHRAIRNSDLSIYKGAGHASFFEDPKRFNSELDAFITNRVTRSAR